MIVSVNAPKDHSYDTGILEALSQPSTRSTRNTFGCNLVNVVDHDIADKIRELVLKGTAIAKRGGSSWASRRRVRT
jgi:hypothetical protein